MALIQSIRRATNRRRGTGVTRARGTADRHVHFHQGPQGRPAPCFDAGCPNPRLSIDTRT
jgi:hypothetical protein